MTTGPRTVYVIDDDKSVVRAFARLIRAAGRFFDTVKTVAPVDFPLTYETMTYATRWPGVIESGNVAAMGHRPRTYEETISDTVRWFEHAGHIDAAARGNLPPWNPEAR